MSYKITRRVWALRNIPTTHKVVLLALADFARDNAECFPHIATIMEHTGQSRPTVFRALAWLEENGHILRKNRSAEGKGSIYTILAPALAQERAQCETPPVSDRYPSAPPPIVEDLTNNLTVPAPDKLEREARATRAPAQEPEFALHGTTQRKPAKRAKHEPPPCLPDVDAALYARWLAHRPAIGCRKPWTVDAQARHVREAEKAGLSNSEAFEYAIAAQWQAFTATYYYKAEGKQNGAPYKSAYERKCEAMHQWAHIDEILDEPEKQDNVIDVSARPANREQFQLLEQK